MITIHNHESQDLTEVLGLTTERTSEIHSLILDKCKVIYNSFAEVFQKGGEPPVFEIKISEFFQVVADNAKDANEVVLFTFIINQEIDQLIHAVSKFYEAQAFHQHVAEQNNPANKIITMDKKIIH